MIQELDETAEAKAMHVGEAETSLAALPTRSQRGGGSTRGGRGFRSFRSSSTRGGSQTRADGSKVCRVCRLAGKTENVYRSHNIGSCRFFTQQDQTDLMSSLNSMQLGSDRDTGIDSPYFDFEAEEEQYNNE